MIPLSASRQMISLYDLYGEENPRLLEDYQEQPDQGMTMGGI